MPPQQPDPWAVVKTEPSPSNEWAEVKTAAAPAETSLAADLGTGVLKGAATTAIGLGELVHKIPGVSAAIDAFYGTPGLSAAAFPAARQATEAMNTAQSVGKGAEQIGEFFLPTGLGGKLGKLAEVIKAGTLTAAQTGSPTAGVVSAGLTGVLGAAAPKLAEMVEGSANKSMIRALGPAGERGPTGDINLGKAEELAPTLLKQRFMPLTQEAARTKAADAVSTTGPKLQQMLAQYGGATFDQPALLAEIHQARAALNVPGVAGQAFLPAQTAAQDALLGQLETDVTQLGRTPSTTAVHALKARWNDIVNFSQKDPAAGSLTSVYKRGGNWIRAILRNNHAEIADADQAFHQASTLNTVLNAATTRRPSAGLAAAVAPFALPTVGAAVGGTAGYQQGGVRGAAGGAVAGAVSVAAISHLIQSPGFRYVSATMKQALADALDSGDPNRIKQLVAGATAQAAKLATAKGDAQ